MTEEQAAALTLGTAGHIDHGKTALVGALTGVDTDRLPEEQARGISITLGYASLPLPSGRSLSVVDVPGHERFVRTMISGATGIDLALIVIACDDGVMPQTREHVAILELLGVRTAVVALTKRDLVDDEGAELARADAEELLGGTALAGSAIVETSVRTGTGLDDLRAALDRAADTVAPRSAEGATRLPIDRAFTLRGIGTVVTGTLWSGSIATGDRLALMPGDDEVRVRSVQVHDQAIERAQAGRRVAAALVGVERGAIARGSTLATPGAFPASYRLDVELRALADGPGVAHGALVQVLAGTACIDARVALLETSTLPAGSAGLAQLRLRELVTAARGDRVIVRTTAPQATIAGGVVLDPAPARHGGSETALARLRLLASGDAHSLVRAALQAAAWPLALAQIATAGAARLRGGHRRAQRTGRVGRGPAAAGRGVHLAARRPLRRGAGGGAHAAGAARGRASARARAARACRGSAWSGRRRPARPPGRRRRARARRRACAARGGSRRWPRLARRGGRRPARRAGRGRVHAARPAGAPPGLGVARARIRGALHRARAERADRALRRRPRLHRRALRRGA